jgi:hypothetical protein
MTEPTHDAALGRRSFLHRTGLVASGAAIGTVAAAALPASAQVTAQAIDFVYAPVGPVRSYDSRSSSGPLVPGQEIALLTGLHEEDPPPLAITVNITVTQTVGAGYLAVFPDDQVWPGTSSVNWFGPNQDLSNNAFVFIPPENGVIVVRGGGSVGSRAQFVIDTIGASVGFDFAEAVTAAGANATLRGLTAAYARPWTAR